MGVYMMRNDQEFLLLHRKYFVLRSLKHPETWININNMYNKGAPKLSNAGRTSIVIDLILQKTNQKTTTSAPIKWTSGYAMNQRSRQNTPIPVGRMKFGSLILYTLLFIVVKIDDITYLLKKTANQKNILARSIQHITITRHKRGHANLTSFPALSTNQSCLSKGGS